MAIQMRRGPWSQFDPTKMLPGEWAVILSGHPDTSNGQALYHCFAAGVVKQIATIEDAATIIANATEDIRDELTQDIASALAQVGAATNAANTATANANTATSAANAATQAATSASERAEDAIDAMGDISELAVPLMSKDVRGGAKLEEHGGLVLRNEKLGIGSLVQESDGYVRGGLAEVTAEGHAEQVATTGKNLLRMMTLSQLKNFNRDGTWNGNAYIYNGITYDCVFGDDRLLSSVTVSGTASAYATIRLCTTLANDLQRDTQYVLSGSHAEGRQPSIYDRKNQTFLSTQSSGVFTLSSSATYTSVEVILDFGKGYTASGTYHFQIELGSTATEYEPYTGGLPSPRPDWEQPIEVVTGHTVTGKTGRFVDLEVRNANDQLLSTTPIPLPSRGWVGSLPDGTADSLRLDGAGKCEWTLPTKMETFDGSSDESWNVTSQRAEIEVSGIKHSVDTSVAANGLCSHFMRGSVSQTYYAQGTYFSISRASDIVHFSDGTGSMSLADFTTRLASNPVTILYPLATPVTEDCGYVEDWPTDIPEGATVTIPELDEVGIRYFVDSTVTELARQWYERAYAEIGQAVVDLAQRVSALES